MIWNGVPLGFTRQGKPWGYAGTAPTIVLGPQGSGKTVKLIANQLLDDDSGKRTYVVIDPKAEVCAITSKFRRTVSDVKIINPYGLLVDQRPDLKSDKWNPLAALEPGTPTFNDDSGALGQALIKTDSNEHQRHFPDGARSMATGWLMQECKDAKREGRPPSLLRVRMLATQDGKPMRDAIRRVIAEGDPAIISRLAKFLDDNDELANLKSTFEVASPWMTSPPIQADMETDAGVDFRDGRKRCSTYYIIVPTEELEDKAVYLRLALSAALRAIYRTPGMPVTLIVEEGFVLGHHALIEQALSILRGFDGNVTIVFQSLAAQIKQLYPKTWPLFLSGSVCAFRPGDLETAEWMSKRAGETIRPVLSASDPSSPHDYGPRPSWQQQKRQRVQQGKLFSMPDDRALVWRPGEEAPTVVRMKAYHEIPALNRRASPNPYFKGNKRGRGGFARVAGLAAVMSIGAALAAWLFGLS
jgi:type IV secretion system protein VirD4